MNGVWLYGRLVRGFSMARMAYPTHYTTADATSDSKTASRH